MLEQEIKFLVPDRFRVPDFAGVAPGLTATPAEEQQYTTTYWDTPDSRLRRWGCSLRCRTGEGWTLKLPTLTEGPVVARPELPFAVETEAPPDEALRLVRAYLRHAPLQRFLELATVRCKVRLLTEAGFPAAEVVDDVVTVQGAGTGARFREVEVELGAAGDATLLTRLARRLRDAGAGEPDPTSKLTRAMAGRPVVAPEVEAPDLPRRPTGPEIVRTALAGAVRSLLLADPLVRLGDDPEAVHQARVATRRLRALLRTFRPFLDPAWATALQHDLRGLADALGAVRDAEVLLQRLRERAQELPEQDRLAAGPLLDRGGGDVAAARGTLLQVLDTDGYLDLVERLIRAANAPALTPAAFDAGRKQLRDLVAKPWRRLARAVSALGTRPDNAALHAVRIRTKYCRYAAEAVVPAFGKPAGRFASAAAQVQAGLGAHQHSVTARAWLRQVASDGEQTFVAGELAMLEAAAAASEAATWPAAWKAMRRRRPERW